MIIRTHIFIFVLTTFVASFMTRPVMAQLRLLTNGSLARGALDSKSYHGGTLYETVQKKFDSAGPLRLSEIDGWYAGRCFFSDSPMQSVASILIVGHPLSSSQAGPEFTEESLKSVLPLIDTRTNANTYDSVNSDQISIIRSAVRSKWSLNSFATESSHALIVDGLRTFDVEARTYELRKGRKHLYLRLSCAEPGFCFNDRGHGTGYKLINNEGESTTACYYFKRLRKHDSKL